MQVNDHLNANGLVEIFQSAYKVGHSTESALLWVQNDILHSIDDGKSVLLLMLDLSAAFDTVDHRILLQRLHDPFGIQGTVYRWFESYLALGEEAVCIYWKRAIYQSSLNMWGSAGVRARAPVVLTLHCTTRRHHAHPWGLFPPIC